MTLTVTEHGSHIAIITMDNQAKRNALSRQDLADLGDLWLKLQDAPYRCLILTGAGEQSFCAGADLSGDLSASPELSQSIYKGLLKYGAYRKPIVAAVNGDCAGGGVELLLSTDIRAAAPEARFGLPEVKWGVYPFGGAALRLRQQIAHVHAMELILGGQLIDANEAARINLINRVLPRNELMPWAINMAETIAANSPMAVQAVKEQISATDDAVNQTREAMEQALGDRVRASPDFAEGVAAFQAKRPANY
ncbi:MAG: enoyl-CoA hydratase-related protein [Alphaproteobacteria bacterium]|jgi:E-phenylitaconyl-CoA hydratase|nr:enoyl-CoA hydratase [Rhodospirillaceae bacterium]MDP6022378.1 enoyl-CoA hydratase-related protein [Alphaproteobacteria bacterium]MDP6254432.1 enoyl-CoA hydratase-related protein [Alphaproteobacteria bacterium]MDP7053799.1 enoyl-CoA hydratase-related protein [Alphaproteobacteria bacterium]MDP7227675.1 enoyl-CoA hydratase-related protein [Alphaproteobacteria bacterium]|tara:strand:- start:982 stop:1734 length:753 start_codon:yes stop_codon:yes gene_type:complete